MQGPTQEVEEEDVSVDYRMVAVFAPAVEAPGGIKMLINELATC